MDQSQKEMDYGFNIGLNQQIVSSSSSSSKSCHVFFNSTQDHKGFYQPQLYNHPQDEYYGYRGGGGSSYEIQNKVGKLTLWKKEDDDISRVAAQNAIVKDSEGEVKWRPRLMKTTKHEQGRSIAAKIEVIKKVKSCCSSYSELNNSNTSYSYNCNSPIRVCSDCHTTKTPLWRSGPKGPKSLCNACGIRQRKARRALAAGSDYPAQRGEAAKVKKRCKVSSVGGSSSSKMGFEEFMINLSNKLGMHSVFPQDEKEAAILLMALSSGLVHA